MHKDSSGVFTIAAPRVVQPFSLADAQAYPLKWVQSAVRSGSASIELWSHPQSIRVRAVEPSSPLCVESLRRELLWPNSQDSRALRDLALGLRAAMPRYPEVVVRSQGLCLKLARGGRLKVEEEDCSSGEFTVIAHPPTADWHAGLANLERCRFAPVKVSEGYGRAQTWFSGDTGGFWGRNKLLHLQVTDLRLRSEDCVTGGQMAPATVEGESHRGQPSTVLWRTAMGKPDRWLEATGAPLCRADIRISAGLSGQGRLIFVDGGVAMQAISVDLGCPGCTCVCSADGLNIDEHRLAVIEDLSYSIRVEWIREIVRSYARRLPDRVQHFNPVTPKPHWTQHILLGALVGAIDPVWGLVAATGSYWFERWRERPDYSRSQLVASVSKRLASLNGP